MTRETRAAISVPALRHNLAVARSYAGASRVMAVVKGDGYGHGLLRVAYALRGADGFAVTCLEEAIPLREAGFAHPILLLEGPYEPDEVQLASRYRLDLVVHSEWQISVLRNARLPRPVNVWLKVDSGMHRLGLRPEQVPQAHARLSASMSVAAHIRLITHLAEADDRESPVTQRQLECFAAGVDGLHGERSVANSAGLLAWPPTRADWVRPGIMLYGATPFDVADPPHTPLRPVMTLTTRLNAIYEHHEGDAIGYGGTWVCPETMPVGVAAIGYGDGYPRHAPSGTPVLVNGTRTQVIGRVSMDMICIDLRGVPEPVDIGDTVTLWGDGLPAEEVADWAGTIAYELFCTVTRRVRFHEERDPHGAHPNGL
ncbi:MAG: alanine racemase [Ectothiorhodospiraceae bacterium]